MDSAAPGRTPLSGVIQLYPCDVPDGGAVTFEIDAFLGMGGVCLAYAGTLHAQGGPRYGLLKEFFPREEGLMRCADGAIFVPPEKRERFGDKLRFVHERHRALSKYVSAHPDTVNVLPQLHGAYRDGADSTRYLFFPMTAGTPYDNTESTDFIALLDQIRQIALQLRVLHDNGFVHLDVKPGNLLVEKGSGYMRLLDFDSLQKIPVSREGMRYAVRTRGYAAPEYMNLQLGQIGPPCDVYALGATLYARLYGHAPRISPLGVPDVPLPLPQDNPLFSRMRMDTHALLQALLQTALAPLPARYADMDAFLAALHALISSAQRDAQELSLYEQCMAACALHAVSDKHAEAYLGEAKVLSPFTPDRVRACLDMMETNLFYAQRWTELEAVCRMLLAHAAPPSSRTAQELYEDNREHAVRYLLSAYNGLGQIDRFTDAVKTYGVRSVLEMAEHAKDGFCFAQALALTTGQERRYAMQLECADTRAKRRAALIELTKLYGKTAQILCHMNRYEDAFRYFDHCLAYAGHPDLADPVHQLTSSTYALNAACAGADDARMDAAQDAWQTHVHALTGLPPIAAHAPEAYPARFAQLLALDPGKQDYKRDFLLLALLRTVRRRAQDAQWSDAWQACAAAICDAFHAWAQAHGASLTAHPFELIAKLIAELSIRSGRQDEANALRCDALLRRFPPAKQSFLESLLCLCGQLEIAQLMGRPTAALGRALRTLVSQRIEALSGEEADALRTALSPLLAARSSTEKKLACLTYIYR